MRFPNQHTASRVEIAHPDLGRISRFRSPDESFAIRPKSRPLLVIQRWVQSARFAAISRHDPQMRNSGVCFEIDIYTIEHDPFAIGRGHRRADALQFHHVFESERTLLRWRLCEHRGGKQKERCEKTFHKRPSFRLTSSGATAFRGAHASGVLAIAFCDRELFPTFVHSLGTSSQAKVRRRRMRRPARCKRALPRNPRTCRPNETRPRAPPGVVSRRGDWPRARTALG